jgi:hypothetical protein
MYTYTNTRNNKTFTALYPDDSVLKSALSLKSGDEITVTLNGESISTLRYYYGRTERIA